MRRAVVAEMRTRDQVVIEFVKKKNLIKLHKRKKVNKFVEYRGSMICLRIEIILAEILAGNSRIRAWRRKFDGLQF